MSTQDRIVKLMVTMTEAAYECGPLSYIQVLINNRYLPKLCDLYSKLEKDFTKDDLDFICHVEILYS